MVLGKLPVPGRPTILITVGQGPIALAVGADGGGLEFLLSSIPSLLSPSLWETARYRLKYCLKGPLNPKQPTRIEGPCNVYTISPRHANSLHNVDKKIRSGQMTLYILKAVHFFQFLLVYSNCMGIYSYLFFAIA